jgi:hypothetical protein
MMPRTHEAGVIIESKTAHTTPIPTTHTITCFMCVSSFIKMPQKKTDDFLKCVFAFVKHESVLRPCFVI